MRLRCRLGIHKWGKWSRHWYLTRSKYTLGYFNQTFPVFRTLECQCCGMWKSKEFYERRWFSDAAKREMGCQPIWD